MKLIKDEFTNLPVSRQRKWQLRMKKRGCCPVCGLKAKKNGFCLLHYQANRERTAFYQTIKKQKS